MALSVCAQNPNDGRIFILGGEKQISKATPKISIDAWEKNDTF